MVTQGRGTAADAVVVAHEIGHQLDFNHDNLDSDPVAAPCAASGNIMGAVMHRRRERLVRVHQDQV